MSRTYLDFYLGFGYLITVYLLLQAALLWQLARLAQSEPRAVRALIASCVVANLFSALVAWRFIFLVPVIFSGVITALLGLAIFLAGREASAGAAWTGVVPAATRSGVAVGER